MEEILILRMPTPTPVMPGVLPGSDRAKRLFNALICRWKGETIFGSNEAVRSFTCLPFFYALVRLSTFYYMRGVKWAMPYTVKRANSTPLLAKVFSPTLVIVDLYVWQHA